MRPLEALLDDVRREAARSDFPIDLEVYVKAGKDPLEPVLFAGALDAPVCFFGRDLGKTEVAQGQPLIGAGGRLIRAGVYEAVEGRPPAKTDRLVESVLQRVLLANTVPYKPPGNKAYTYAVKERFRPFVAELLTTRWTGSLLIPLGTEALDWFEPYVDPKAFADLHEGEDRFEKTAPCILRTSVAGADHSRPVTLAPLPHPSPLNRRWLPRLPELLSRRLAGIWDAES